MLKFLNYKSQIVSSKRDSQKIQQSDLDNLIREYQKLKTVKKQVKKQREFLRLQKNQNHWKSKEILSNEDQFFIYSSNFSIHQNISEQPHCVDKDQSTMSSLSGSQSFTSSQENKYQSFIDFPEANSLSIQQAKKQQFNSLEKQSDSIKPHSIFETAQKNKAKLDARLKLQKVKYYLQKCTENYDEAANFYLESQHKKNYFQIKNPNNISFQLTSRQLLQLGEVSSSKSKLRQNCWSWEQQNNNILIEDEEKIEKLFREEYKDLFQSSLSNIQFLEANQTNNSLKNQFQGSQGLFSPAQPQKKTQFDSILDIINQKYNQDIKSQKQIILNQQKPKNQMQNCQKRQKFMILNRKEQNIIKQGNKKVPKNSKKEVDKSKKIKQIKKQTTK